MPSSSPPADEPAAPVRRRRRWPWLLALGALLVWGGAAALLLVGAASDLRSGRSAAEAARADLSPEALADGRSLADLRTARDDFGAAHDAVANPLLAPVRILPVLGRQLRSVEALSGAAHEVSDAAVDALVEVRAVLDDPATGPVARLSDVQRLGAAVREANQRVAAVDDLGPRRALVSPLADARNELAEELGEAREALADASAGAVAAERLLEGPSRYLVVAANNAEMRAGSGMWLSGGVLTTGGGRLALGEVRPLADFANPRKGAVDIGDADIERLWSHLWNPSSEWRDLMVSPRMAASAELGTRMWEAAGEPPIDGVLVVDPVALAAVIRAVGPVEAGGRTITADDVVPMLLHEQYLVFGPGDPSDFDQLARRDSLGSIASAAFAALDGGSWSPAVLARELGQAIAGRHLLAWSRDPIQQRGWESAGMAGTLQPDSLLLSVLNRGVNKLDWFLRVDAELEEERAGEDTMVTLRLRFRNAVDPAGLPRYVVGPPDHRQWPAGRYVGVVAINLPGDAREIRLGGAGVPATSGRDGTSIVVANQLLLLPGQQQQWVLTFRRQAGSRLRIEPSARVPSVKWRNEGKEWQDNSLRTVNL